MSGRLLRVAIVDDDSVDRLMIRRLLEKDEHWQVEQVEFSSGEDCLEGLREGQVDVILLDYDLGGATGLEVLEGLKERGVSAPVVALTGRGDDAVAVSLLKGGAADYISKSRVSTSSLKRAISNAIEKQSLRKSVQRYRESLEERNAELEQQREEIEAFYHTLSHELKTPLTSIREFVCILSEGIAGEVNEEQQEFLGICKRSCDQLKRIMNDLIDLSRIDTGKFSIQREILSVRSLLEDVERLESGQATSRGIHFEVDCEEVCVSADRERTQQVLVNLIDNALKFTAEGGKITLTAKVHDENQVVISVRDTGRGIPPEQHDQIFDRHHQTRCRDKEIGGLGLGLSLCKELVELHGGEIWLESEIDRGTEFQFTLPVAQPVPVPS